MYQYTLGSILLFYFLPLPFLPLPAASAFACRDIHISLWSWILFMCSVKVYVVASAFACRDIHISLWSWILHFYCMKVYVVALAFALLQQFVFSCCAWFKKKHAHLGVLALQLILKGVYALQFDMPQTKVSKTIRAHANMYIYMRICTHKHAHLVVPTLQLVLEEWAYIL